MRREPLVTVAFVLAAVGAILALLKAFGVDVTNEQQAAISGITSVIAPLLVAVLVRPKVTPVADPPAVRRRAGARLTVEIGGLLLVLLVIVVLWLMFR